MQLTMLGTGHAAVTRCYNTCFVLEEAGSHFLVDGGGGNTLLRRLAQANLRCSDMHDIFVTHKHLDHLLGIVWMLRMLSHAFLSGRGTGPVRIVSHAEVIDILHLLASRLLQPAEAALLGGAIELMTVQDGTTLPILGHRVTFFDIGSTKDTQFGFAMDYAPGKKLVCLGDEPCHPCCEPHVRGAAWLMHEAFCLACDAQRYRPYEKHHSTVLDACALAQRLQVDNLILYHTEDDNLASRKARYTAEGRTVYEGNLLVPDDLEVIEIC